jgi:hypothetical protein
MQGVEFVDHALLGGKETVWYPTGTPAPVGR